MQCIDIDQSTCGKRVDNFVVQTFKVPSRNFVKKNWDKLVSVNEKKVKPSYKLRVGDNVKLEEEFVDEILEEHSLNTIIPQDGKLNIIMENSDFLVINKPKGLVVHPGIGNSKDTLANYVVGYLSAKNEYDPRIERGGVVHRLDKSVSGLILFAKTLEAQKHFQREFEEHRVNKVYRASIVLGKNLSNEIKPYISQNSQNVTGILDALVNNDFRIDDSWFKAEGYIGRSHVNRMKMVFKRYMSGGCKYALSYIKPLNSKEFLIAIKTGRMYQIRATLEYLGIHIVGDTLFETSKGGSIPDAIELESVLLSCKDLNEEMFVARLI